MTTQPPHGDMGAIRSTATALVHGRNRPSSPVIREKKRKEKKIFPEGVWLSCLLAVTWMPTLNGSCPGARPKPPQLPLRRRMTVQPPHGGLDANARRLRRRVAVLPPHGDMDANAQRPLPWCTAETAPAPPPKTCNCPASSR